MPDFRGFAVKGNLMFIQPLGGTLRGFHWEASAFSRKEFYVNVFFLPLYVPIKQLHFTFGHRLGQTKRWSVDRPDLENDLRSEMKEELPFLMRLETATAVAKALESLTKPNQSGYVNPHCYEAFAYALVRAGDTTAAVRVMETLLQNIHPTVSWENEIASRARLLRDMLEVKPQEAQQQLLLWESTNIHDLGLESFNSDQRTR